MPGGFTVYTPTTEGEFLNFTAILTNKIIWVCGREEL